MCLVLTCLPVVALENYVKASHTLMFGSFSTALEPAGQASTSSRHHVLLNRHEERLYDASPCLCQE